RRADVVGMGVSSADRDALPAPGRASGRAVRVVVLHDRPPASHGALRRELRWRGRGLLRRGARRGPAASVRPALLRLPRPWPHDVHRPAPPADAACPRARPVRADPAGGAPQARVLPRSAPLLRAREAPDHLPPRAVGRRAASAFRTPAPADGRRGMDARPERPQIRRQAPCRPCGRRAAGEGRGVTAGLDGIQPGSAPRKRRLMIIGLDAATFDVIDPMMEAGQLPNLKRLFDAGSCGPLRSTTPPITSQAWATAFTGVNAGKHGLWEFAERISSYRLRLVNGSFRRAPAVWDYLSASGRTVGVINVPF